MLRVDGGMTLIAVRGSPRRAMHGRGNGKVILLGEHAVVYGVPAIAAGLPGGASAAVVEREGPATLHIAPWEVTVPRGGELPLGAAFDALLSARESVRSRDARAATSRSVDARVELPGSAGLGSSAALGVAVLRALDAHDGITRDFEEAQRLALAWERIFHGNPSGIDTAMALAGGLALYRRSPAEGQRALEPLRARAPLSLVIAHSGEPGSTKAMVEQVARQRARAPEKFAGTLEAFEAIVQNGVRAIEGGELRALGQLLDLSQQLLASWLVSTETLEDMCSAARDAGALGAKLTGGGGGGCMIALVPDPRTDADGTARRVRDALAAMGREVFEATIEATIEPANEPTKESTPASTMEKNG